MNTPFLIHCSQRALSLVTIFLMISFSFSASSQNVEKKICQTKECLASVKNFKKSMNFDVNPCDDFYTYACGKWSRNSNESLSIIESSMVENYEEIIDFLTQNNSNDEPEAVHKARKFFSLCRSRAAYKNSLQQIKIMLDKIGLPTDSFTSSEIEINFDYTTILARASRLSGAKLYFDIEIFPNPYNKTADKIWLTVHSYHNKHEAVKRMCGGRTSISCTRLLSQLNLAKNLTTEEILKRRSTILKMQNIALTSDDYQVIDTEIKSALNSNLPLRYSLKELQTLTDNIAVEVNSKIPTLNWTRYIEELIIDRENLTIDLSDPNKLQITIGNLNFLKEMIKYIHKRPNTTRIAYEILQEVVYTLQPYVDSSKGTTMGCTRKTKNFFTWVIYYMFAKKEKYIKAKTEVRTIFEHVRHTFQQLLEQAPWMDEMTRQRALKKLRLMRSYIAYPSTVTNPTILDDFYKDVQITDNFYDTVISFNRRTQLMKDPPNDDFWSQQFSPSIAHYAPETNSVCIPAGFLGFPFYNDGLDALHFGAIGSVVGHEIAHAFDNNGRRFNEEGDVEDWWKPETAKLFEEKAICFAQANRNYRATSNDSRFRRMDFNKYNLGEDLSDNLGFKESLLAYRNYASAREKEPSLPQFENFTQEQLLTLAYANKLCETPPSSQHTLSDGNSMSQHSPVEFRVNGVFQNSEEFSKIWKCPEGSRMNPVKKCTLW